MGCVSSQNFDKREVMGLNKSETIKNLQTSKLKDIEKYLLELMYNDLAKRCKGQIVSRDTFQVFFHNSGLMAELMFSKFDELKTGTITKEEFFKAFEINVKGSFEERAESLFQFYHMQKSGGIRFGQLLRILLSYPLEELSTMVFEEKFLKQLGEHMIALYFGPEKQIEEKIIIEENSELSNQEVEPKNKSLYNPSSKDLAEIQNRIRRIVQEQKQNSNGKPQLPSIFKKDIVSFTNKPPRLEKLLDSNAKLQKSGSMSLIQVKKIRKDCKLKSNITSVAKRYATYLFTSANLDKQKDVFSKKQFCDLLKAHPSIFDIFQAGFHKYIWQLNSLGRPQYCDITPEVEGEGKLWENNISTILYYKLIKSTILVFDSKNDQKAKDVINLEGLNIDFQEINDAKCVIFSHRDGYYPKKMISFQSREAEWFKVLEVFKESSFLDDYIKLQRIGKGNFSTVYRCKQKTTGNFAALKIIQPKKLTSSEREVLKRQIGMLKQCHHPNIVKFIEEYKTNTHIYIVTELLSEGDLFEYTRKKSFLEEYEAAIIFKQLTEAILYLNEMGIIHRDLKPENIMIIMGQDKKIVRRVKIIDFGFGIYKDQLKQMSQEQKYAGTPGFIAPEVYQMRQYDQKIDTFSLGIILYFMLYGYLPFQANFIEQIKQLTLSCAISLQNDHWSNISEDAKNLVYKVLTFADKRISTKQILEHPWIKNIEKLKQYQGRNKKRIRILD